MTITNKTKCLIKDLELQIDYLVGYSPSGNHWKQEYSIRKSMIDSLLTDENTPQHIIDKINNIQESLFKLRNGDRHEQEYIEYTQSEYIKEHPPIKVHDGMTDETYYI